jgi:hypothetical protein
VKKNGVKELTRYYLSGCYEIDDPAVGSVKEKLYLGGDFYTAAAVYVKSGAGSWLLYYICRDYLGGITHITNSPVLRSAVVSPLASGAGHVAGGTTANLFAGQDLGEAFLNSFDGIGKNMAFGGALGIATTIGVSYANKVSQWETSCKWSV